MKEQNRPQIISLSEMNVIREIAAKHNITVAELGHTLVHVNDKKITRWIRLSEEERTMLDSMVQANETTITHWCAMACKAFLSNSGGMQKGLISAAKVKSGKRDRTIGITQRNRNDDADLAEIAQLYSINISTLYRYCIMNYDGKYNL